jgi:microcystin-dependent protein
MRHTFSRRSCPTFKAVTRFLSARFLRSSSGALGVLLLAQSATAQVCFEGDPPINAGLHPFDMLSADLDGDGDTDLVATEGIDPVVSVLLNHGDGTFAPSVLYAAGLYPSEVTGADLDADGDTDLAVACYSATVSVLLNQGNGTFGAYVPYGGPQYPTGITSADFDGDGDIDVAASDEFSGTVSVLLNQGQGSFASHVQYAAGTWPFSVTSADLDGDGDVDLAVPNFIGSRVSVLLNHGNGTFAAPMAHNVGADAFHLTNADLNGDGRADLVTANDDNDYVAVLINQGGGAFAPHVKYPVAELPRRVVATDLDEDGDLDLAAACAGPHSVSLLLNRGDGTFAPYQELGSGTVFYSMTHADFDGDGDRELAVQNIHGQVLDRTITVYRNCVEQGIGFCFGDGSLLTKCPCASPDTVPTPAAATAHGCANSLNFAGAGLVAVGEVAPAPGTLTFRARIAQGYSGFAFLVKGEANVTSGIAAGDGVRCVDGALVRFGAHHAGTNGALVGNWTYPNSLQTTPVSIATAQAAGEIAYYQLCYRDEAANFCNPATVNWSNGYRLDWRP